MALLYVLAAIVERARPTGRRLRPREVVAEFEKTIADELDLLREAANASQLRRNFADGRLLMVPEVYWDWCNRDVMVMQRIDGIPVNAVERLRAAGIDIPQLARDGVEIFFTQVFRDGFFHADMHPGNIFVRTRRALLRRRLRHHGHALRRGQGLPRHQLHGVLPSRLPPRGGRAPRGRAGCRRDTRVDEFEGAIRSVCEPIFDRPLKEIYFGRLLMRLFEVSRRFRMEIQPQLVLLQKTLLQVEGLGRQLDPDLDLRRVAQPILERWMNEQVGLRGLVRSCARRRRSGRARCRSCRAWCTGCSPTTRAPPRGRDRRAWRPRSDARRASSRSSQSCLVRW